MQNQIVCQKGHYCWPQLKCSVKQQYARKQINGTETTFQYCSCRLEKETSILPTWLL
jgi:hypothetical protein